MAENRFGPYELLAPLATGGMAQTHLARRAGDRPRNEIALKRILPDVADDPELRALFVEETKVASELFHPNVVRTLESGEVDGELYLTMEYVWGEDLRALARAGANRGSQLPRDLVAHVVRESARGIHYAHEFASPDGQHFGLVHRDVSPPNLMVGFDGRVVVVDFGIAKVERRYHTVRAGQLKGKFAYMSPEQVSGLPIDRRSDIFSIGVVLYEFTVGRRLFRAESDVATMATIKEALVPPPRSVDPDYPRELERIALRALARAPEDRYQTMAELADDLDGWLGRDGDHAERLTAWMKETFAERIEELASIVGVDSYSGPGGPPDLGSRQTDPESGMSERDDETNVGAPEDEDDATSSPEDDAEAAFRKVLEDGDEFGNDGDSPKSAVHQLPHDQENDPFFQANRSARPIFAFIGLVAAALGLVIGYKLVTDGYQTSHLADYEPGPSRADFEPEAVPPPDPPPTTPTQVESTPAGAAIVVNGVATRETTPSEVELVDGAPNVVSLHLEGYDTYFAEARAGTELAVELTSLPPPPQPDGDEEPEPEPVAEGSAEPVDPGPGPGQGRVLVRARDVAGHDVPAQVLVNGDPVGDAPVRVDVDAGARHHVSVRMAGMRDSSTYVRAIPWVDFTSEHVVTLELTADAGAGNRWTTLRLRTVPQDATVTVDGEERPSTGLVNVDSPGHHVVEISAPDHVPMMRTVDGRLGQVLIDGVLEPIRTGPALLTLSVEPPETLVFVERVRHASAGATQLQTPTDGLEVESGLYRVTLDYRSEDGERVRGRFETELSEGSLHRLDYALVDGEFAEVAHEVMAP